MMQCRSVQCASLWTYVTNVQCTAELVPGKGAHGNAPPPQALLKLPMAHAPPSAAEAAAQSPTRRQGRLCRPSSCRPCRQQGRQRRRAPARERLLGRRRWRWRWPRPTRRSSARRWPGWRAGTPRSPAGRNRGRGVWVWVWGFKAPGGERGGGRQCRTGRRRFAAGPPLWATAQGARRGGYSWQVLAGGATAAAALVQQAPPTTTTTRAWQWPGRKANRLAGWLANWLSGALPLGHSCCCCCG